MNYDNIIKYENEHSGLDFKSIQYKKNTHTDFLKDIIALANADVEGERLIIIGIKHTPNGNREIVPIGKNDFVDQAIYQQLIRENVEPELMITYDPYKYEDRLIGIIRVSNCSNPPYIMKKDFDSLKKGDCFIRKGSHQVRALRADFDRFYESRENGRQFYGKVSIGFSGSNYSDEIRLSTIGKIELPSDRETRKITEILVKKKKQEKLSGSSSLLEMAFLDSMVMSPFASVPYEKRSIEKLEENLQNVKKDYKENDLYEIFEVHAHKLNFDIFNDAKEYIKDATCILEVERHYFFTIADHIFEKPKNDHFLARLTPGMLSVNQYPTVKENPTSFTISQLIGDVKHQIPRTAFEENIRFTIFKVPPDGFIKLRFKLFAKNLPSPIMKDLKIIVDEKNAKHINQGNGE